MTPSLNVLFVLAMDATGQSRFRLSRSFDGVSKNVNFRLFLFGLFNKISATEITCEETGRKVTYLKITCDE